jgi:hypothetical protein
MLWYHEKSHVNSTMGSYWPYLKKRNKSTVYYNIFFSPNNILQHRFVLKYRQIDTTLLRNFRIHRSRYRNGLQNPNNIPQHFMWELLIILHIVSLSVGICLSLYVMLRSAGRGGWSLVQRSPTECDESECDCESSTTGRPWPTRGCYATGEKKNMVDLHTLLPELLTKLCLRYLLYARRLYSGCSETLVNIYHTMMSYAKKTTILITKINQNNKIGLCLIHIKKWQFVI